MATKVMFRKFDDGQIIALFPEIRWSVLDKNLVMSYMHYGQHSPATMSLVKDTKQANPDEYADLLTELKNIGYTDLKIDYADDDYEIGSCLRGFGSLTFRGDTTDNGYVYKNSKAWKEQKGICYIAESGFEDFDDNHDCDELKITFDNFDLLITRGAVCTWQTIHDEVNEQVWDMLFELQEYEGQENRKKLFETELYNKIQRFIKTIENYVFDMVDWQCPCTFLNEVDLYEAWDLFESAKDKE